MAEDSVREPLLSNGFAGHVSSKKPAFFVGLVKWVLKIVMWAIFLSWVGVIFLYPSEFVQGWFRKWILASRKTSFGISGSIFLLFSAPILVIAFLAYAYVTAFPKEYGTKKSKFPSFRLWTFPILVDGPFGVVSAAELIGILLFSAYIFWAVSAYSIQIYREVPHFPFSSKIKSYFALEILGLRLGSIGLFCLTFLFLPIARGSILLRLIDIPFEHATRYHVWLGHATMAIFTLHGLCYVVAWSMQGRLLQELLEWKNIGVANLPGVISLLAGLLMWVTSLHPVRKHCFEVFFYTHQLYIVFVVFLALHVGDFIFSIAAGGIFLFLLDRFLRFWQSRSTVNIISASCLPCGTVELVLSKPTNLNYNALSFIFLQVRELSWLQWHPFSVSSSPLDGKNHLSILIKVLGEWTCKLRERITDAINDPNEVSSFQPSPKITVSVEGPYGHEAAYHLTYENLILVAGGIGISPFLAILSDILHRIRDKKPCLPKKILIVWAVKKSKELSLLSSVNVGSIFPSFSDNLHLDMQIYVTQESGPPLEEGLNHKSAGCSLFPMDNGCPMSSLVGTGNNLWSGTYVFLSTVGFIVTLGLVEKFYVTRFHISSWWCLGILFFICMIAGIFIFGGLVIFLWNLWGRSVPSCFRNSVEDDSNIDSTRWNEESIQTNACHKNLASLANTNYGSRPNFQAIFESVSEKWGHVDIGVVVCGPPTLQSSVARACRSQNIWGRWNHPIFHFNSHSFDL